MHSFTQCIPSRPHPQRIKKDDRKQGAHSSQLTHKCMDRQIGTIQYHIRKINTTNQKNTNHDSHMLHSSYYLSLSVCRREATNMPEATLKAAGKQSSIHPSLSPCLPAQKTTWQTKRFLTACALHHVDRILNGMIRYLQ